MNRQQGYRLPPRNILLSLLMAVIFLTAMAKGGQDGAAKTPVPSEVFGALTDQERAWLREHPVIRVVQDPGWSPVEFTNKRGEPSGMTGDYLRLVEKRLGVKFERVRNLTWQEAYARLKRWDIDMTTSVAVTPERTEFWAFTKPYMEIPIVIVTQADVTYVADMRELAGKSVAVVDGYAVNDWIPRDFPEISLVRVKTVQEGLDLLQRGDVFAYIDSLLAVGDCQAKMKATSIKIAGKTPYVNAQCMAVRKDWAIFAGILQKALESVSETERNDIYRKWLPIRYEQGFDYTLLWQALAVFAVIVLALLVWNRKLAREITDRKKAEAALMESEQRFRRAVVDSPFPTLLHAEDGAVLQISRSWTEISGYAPEEIRTIGDWTERAYGERKDAVRADIDRLYALDHRDDEGEYTIRTKSGVTRVWHFSSAPLGRLPDGRRAVISMATDVTERKQAEQALRESEERLRQSEKMTAIGQLAGGVAHDFNNQLTAILGYADMLVDRLDDERLRRYAVQVVISARRAADLTQKLLAFGRKGKYLSVPVSAHQLLSEVVTILEHSIDKRIRIRQLLEAGQSVTTGDPSQLQNALLNVALNARDAMPQGGELTIATDVVTLDDAYCRNNPYEITPGQYLRIGITDTGCGMTDEVKKHLFEPFFTTKQPGHGTGMGLASVYGTVRNHRGAINVLSEVGHGTTVRIHLPLAPDADEPEETGPAAPPVRGTARILLVDDEAQIREMAAEMLRDLGHSVATCADGREAVEYYHVNWQQVDLVILDMVMPVMCGRDAFLTMRRLNPQIRALLSSGYSLNGEAQGILDEGVLGFVGKPYRQAELSRAVADALSATHPKRP